MAMSMGVKAGKYVTIKADLMRLGWHYTVSSPEGAVVARGGPFWSRGGALAEAIARASALRLQVAPEVLALLLETDEPVAAAPKISPMPQNHLQQQPCSCDRRLACASPRKTH